MLPPLLVRHLHRPPVFEPCELLPLPLDLGPCLLLPVPCFLGSFPRVLFRVAGLLGILLCSLGDVPGPFLAVACPLRRIPVTLSLFPERHGLPPIARFDDPI